MLNHIGYPEFILNNTALIEYYAGVKIIYYTENFLPFKFPDDFYV